MSASARQTDFTEEQLQFREIVSRFLAARNPMSRVRQLIEAPPHHDADTWAALAGELGATGLHIPEDHGGAGFGAVELGIVLEEMGRHLYCGPYFTSAALVGSTLLAVADDDAQARLLPGLADGSTIATLVLDDLEDPERVGSRIEASADGALSGSAAMVIGAGAASLLIVIAGSVADRGLYAVDADAATVTPLQSLDPTRPVARVEFDATAATRIGAVGAADLHALWRQWSILLAHEQLGAAEALLYGTVEYMQMRVQFGRAIASFQSLKHRCADLLMEVELAKALVHESARVLAAGEDAARITELAHMAKAQASDALMNAARAAIQLRGGIGFTWENDTHFHFKRARASEQMFGAPHRHREWLIAHLEQQETANAV